MVLNYAKDERRPPALCEHCGGHHQHTAPCNSDGSRGRGRTTKRTIALNVDQPKFFDEVSKYGLIGSTCPIGSRVIACLLGGVDFSEALGLAVYGVEVSEVRE
ncbi:hypothetical protein [Phenylobacterium sp.]|uniref:hypothetical protein n=1 Tax=Phenylobacterium sp. TaxID=1871053 RepID=UPI0027306B80|nr:hypothetical protein [Phenylobacterium sp.]MDP1598981.1 hypothetical protein [Phenylobacterium sp.]MDP3590409.1 hypothetical protein [Phenylobacterium sp.]